ncbi:hypothetical protein RD792_008604 [Penstemon davidsonii]|uniref:GRF-type domain-containing protein n=1 Tax=Penstemon davidsonii TaxID=160366 RepID=A0ABR0D9Q1_9LAMI|nr:hypothetical protein RD792_008604 [Penstemon davidsonii]
MSILSSINGTNATEIVFFDLETTVPNKTGQKFNVLEFGAIVVCPRKLIELESYCTLIRPQDLSVVAMKSGRIDGITREAVAKAPPFEEVASKIFSILNGRIWAGHNIQRFDCVRIREAFAGINMPAPVPAGIIDSLGVLSEKFGKRAGNMKMATLADYFGLGQQKHRYLRNNLRIKSPSKYVKWTCAKQLQYYNKKQKSTGIPLEIRGKSICREETSRKSPPSTVVAHQRVVPYTRSSLGKMETSSTSTDRSNNTGGGVDVPGRTCPCGTTVRMFTSRTEKNPGRRFLRCSGVGGQRCEYFEWVDPVCHRVEAIITALLLRLNQVEGDNRRIEAENTRLEDQNRLLNASLVHLKNENEALLYKIKLVKIFAIIFIVVFACFNC